MDVYHLTNSLKSNHPNKWHHVTWNLFSDHENPYFRACHDENIELVRKLIKRGYTADETHLWNSQGRQCYRCRMEGCYIADNRYPKPIFTLLVGYKPDIIFVRKLFDYGLLSTDDIPHEIIMSITDPKIKKWLLEIVKTEN
jgi:hypothetical protein